ncbi:putative toxin-antitoxin system toxin component, PIN family [Desulfonatronum parangueonense]
MIIPRVVLDTNILVAASRSRKGASYAILQALRAGRIKALGSVPLMVEYEAVLKRPDHLQIGGRTEEMVDAFLDALCLLMDYVHLHYLWRPQTFDPADEMVLETALNGRAAALITLNIKDFDAAKKFRLPVLHPGVFIQKLNKGGI